MRWRRKYLVLAILLTVLDAVVTVYYGTAVWAAWSGDILARGLLVVLASMEATSLANVWVQAGSSMRFPDEETESIAVKMGGRSDV